MSEPPRPTPLSLLPDGERPPFAPMVVEHVRDSLKALRRATEQFPEGPRLLTDMFYRELFRLAPQARGMFEEDITPQSDRLLRALLSAADGLDDPERVERKLRLWGVIHRRAHGVDDSHYVYVGQALVRTIKAFVPEASSVLYSSWAAVYAWMAAVMIDGADGADDLRDDPQGPFETTKPSLSFIDVTSKMPTADVIPLGPRGARARRRDTG